MVLIQHLYRQYPGVHYGGSAGDIDSFDLAGVVHFHFELPVAVQQGDIHDACAGRRTQIFVPA